MFFSSRYLRYPVTAAIAATCPVLYQARSSCMVVDRNQRCYTNCVRWLRHKGILLESSPREWLMGYITTRVIMENTLLTANATLPTYDRSALIPVSFILVLARFIALIRLCMPIYWPASTAATGATPKLI